MMSFDVLFQLKYTFLDLRLFLKVGVDEFIHEYLATAIFIYLLEYLFSYWGVYSASSLLVQKAHDLVHGNGAVSIDIDTWEFFLQLH